MTLKSLILPVGVTIIASMAGCGSAVRESQRATMPPSASNLVFAPGFEPPQDDGLGIEAVAAEFALLHRNDNRLGSASADRLPGWAVLEVRHRELLRTTNGRPREFSTTSIRTIERRYSR